MSQVPSATEETTVVLRLSPLRRAGQILWLLFLALIAALAVIFTFLTAWGAVRFVGEVRIAPALFCLFFVGCGLWGLRDAMAALHRQWLTLTRDGGSGLVLSPQGMQLTAEGATVRAPWTEFSDISLRDLGANDANVFGFPVRRRHEAVVAQLVEPARERLSRELRAQGVRGVSPSSLVLSIPPALVEPKLLMRMIERFWQPAPLDGPSRGPFAGPFAGSSRG